MPTSKSKSTIVTTMLTAESAILFTIENSGFRVPTIMVPKVPNHTYDAANIPEVINLNAAVNESMLLKAA